MWISFGGLHCRGLCCGWSGGFIEWVVVFHVKHSALFVGMIEAYSATGKIYLHQQAENQNLTWPSLHTEASHV